jgi:hypothetical protein
LQQKGNTMNMNTYLSATQVAEFSALLKSFEELKEVIRNSVPLDLSSLTLDPVLLHRSWVNTKAKA